jgi:branched-chain amino acid transport system ATP-binding protein
VASRRRIAHGVARSFQNVRLMPHLTTLENVMVGQHCRNADLFGVLQPVNLWPHNRWREAARAALTDVGLERYAGATVKNLPYDVQKRVEVVRAMMAKPHLLLLDEPAAGLNSTETEALQRLLERICGNGAVTLLVVEHDMHFVGALCDEVIVLDFGRKIAEGTPAEIRANARVQEIYLGTPVTDATEPRHAARSA